jgi:hypothetical protein
LKRPKIDFSCPKNNLVQSQNSSSYDHKLTSPVPKKSPCSVPYFSLLWPNIDFSCPKSLLVLSHNLSCYDSISYSPVPKHQPVCPIIRHIMTQYQLLLSQKVTFICSIIHLVMPWHQHLLPHLVRSCFIIVKIMFSSNYWCKYHLIIYVNITFQGVIISHPRYVIVTFHSTLNSLPSVLTISYPHMSQYYLPTIGWFEIADVIFPLLLF